jgi:hypothetical protein
MRRLFIPIVIAAFAAGCGERAIMPTSSLTPGAAAHDAGTPPPPPAAGTGDAELDVGSTVDGSSATTCSANESFVFAYEYFVNKTLNNAFLHIHIDDQGLDAAIHQTNQMIDAHGNLTGQGFVFTITNALGGNIFNGEGGTPHSVTVNLTGELNTGEGTCTANATLTLFLTPPFPTHGG